MLDEAPTDFTRRLNFVNINPLAPNDIYMSYRTANLKTLHFKYLLKKYAYWIF